MFTSHRTFAALSTATFSLAIAVAGLTSNVSADVYHHLDQVAVRIQAKAARLVSETRHYRHSPQYRHLLRDAQQLGALAEHIHDVTHFEGNLRHLTSDVAQLDQVFHHLEGLFDHIEHEAEHGHGHVHGNTRHVKNLLNQIENEIHHLQEDLTKIRRSSRQTNTVIRSYRTSGYGSRYGSGYHGQGGNGHHGYGHHGAGQHRSARGFSIGGGSSKLWFSF